MSDLIPHPEKMIKDRHIIFESIPLKITPRKQIIDNDRLILIYAILVLLALITTARLI